MKRYLAVLFLVAASGWAGADSAEFSKEKILEYAAPMRIPEEGCQYVRDLPPEDIRRIVDLLDFSRDGRGRNMHIFGMTLMKARDLERRGIPYERDYIFGRLTDFVRSCIGKGQESAGEMTPFTGFHHPAIEKLARELVENGDEFERYNAKVWLKQQEAWRRNRARRGRRDASLATSRHRSEARGRARADSAASESAGGRDGGIPWPAWVAAFAALLASVAVWLKSGRRKAAGEG